MKMRNLLNLFRVATRKKTGEAFEVVDFGESLGVFIRSLSLRMSLLISADVTSVISSAVRFKIVLQKKRLLILKSLRSWLVW